MPPNCDNRSSSPSTSHPFVPSLACIAEEEPRIIAIRRITIPDGADVEIPIFDVNLYAPEIPKPPISKSYQRLLAEMEKFIEDKKDAEKYKEMARNLRKKIVIEQAEAERLSKPNLSNREWYWYSERTRRFTDYPANGQVQYIPEEIVPEVQEPKDDDASPETDTEESEDNVFDLNADF